MVKTSPLSETHPSEGNRVQRIAEQLIHAILRGEYPAGSRLPTVRALAIREAVTVPTAQRVLAHLEALQLVTPRQGSGTRVNDIDRCGDLSLFPYWLGAFARQPARAADLLGQFLELRRDLIASLFRRVEPPMVTEALAPASGAVERLQQLAQSTSADRTEELMHADLELMRALLDALGGKLVHRAVLGTMARLLERTPLVARAMYARPRDNLAAFGAVIDAVARCSAERELATLIERELERLDRATVRRYRQLLARALRDETTSGETP